MSLSLKCDNCETVVAEFTLPQRFGDPQGMVIILSIEIGEKSLDLCRKCLAELLASFACAIAPEGISYQKTETELCIQI